VEKPNSKTKVFPRKKKEDSASKEQHGSLPQFFQLPNLP
jgi:hypothetical protein